MSKRRSIILAAALLLFSSMACEPVLAIGWDELLIVFLIIALLFGPLIFRFLRTYRKNKKK